MASKTKTVSDTLTRSSANGPDGSADTFSGTFGLDQFDPRLGTLLSATYRNDLSVSVSGGLINDGNTFSGSAVTYAIVDLDPDNDDGRPFIYATSIQDGLPSVPLLAGFSSTPVSYVVTETSGDLKISKLTGLTGTGEVKVPFDALVGVSAFGGQMLGPQGGSFVSNTTSVVSISYTYREAIRGTNGDNKRTGTDGADVIVGLGGDDQLSGGRQNDTLYGDSGADRLRGEGGNDVLSGGDGRDTVLGNSGNDRLNGGDSDDKLYGGSGADRLDGDAGKDRLYAGQDSSHDVFDFNSVKDSRASSRDILYEFDRGEDEIDLRGIDARAGGNKNNAFDYSGTKAAAHSVWWDERDGDVVVSADVTGDRTADFQIKIEDLTRLSSDDFLL